MAKKLTPVAKPLKSELKLQKVQKKVDLAYEQFQDRTFAERQQSLFDLSRLSALFFHLLSISFAFLFVFSFFLKMISGFAVEEITFSGELKESFSIGVATAITLAALALIELGKRLLARSFSDGYLKQGRTIVGFLAILTLLVAGSIFSSVQGSIVLATYQTAIPDGALINTDSIQTAWKNEVAAEKASIAQLQADPKNMVMDHGKRVLGWNTRETIKRKEARIDKLYSMMETDKSFARSDNAEVISANLIDTSKYEMIAFWVSASVEVFLLIMLFFQRRYLFYTYTESTIGDSLSPTPSKDKKKSKTGQNTHGDGSKKMTNPATDPDVGFDQLVQMVDESTAEGAKDLAYFRKWERVVVDNLEGMSVNKSATKHGIAPGTVKNIRKVIRKYVQTPND